MNRFWKEYFIFMEKKTNTLKKALTGIILSVILIVIDQVTKLMAIHGLMNQQPFVIWDGVFELHYLENRGAAFGILQGKKIFFVIFTLVVLCMIAYLYLKRIPDEKKFRPIDGKRVRIYFTASQNTVAAGKSRNDAFPARTNQQAARAVRKIKIPVLRPVLRPVPSAAMCQNFVIRVLRSAFRRNISVSLKPAGY